METKNRNLQQRVHPWRPNKCQKIIKSHNLENEHQLQSYFIKRIADFLQRKKRKLIGWDEILEGGLPKNAIVQSWRGMNGAMESANNNQFAISSPTSHSYFDYDLQAIDLEKVYSFNPIPKDLNSEKHSFILGGECNMWTEHVPSEKNLDSKVFPRILAMSEVLWSAPKNRNYKDFYERVQYQYKYLEAFGVNYGAETIPVRLDAYTSPEKINITLTKGAKDLDLYYTTNGIIPSKNSTLYKTNIDLKKSSTLLIQAYKNNKPYGECSKHKFTKHLGNGIEPNLDYKYSKFYTGGGKNALTNGVRGSNNFRDGNWQGVQKSNMGITINLGKEQKINTLSAAFFQKQDSWIFLPRKIEFFSSNDGKTFSLIKTLTNTISPKKDGEFIKEFTIELQNTTSKYVKIIAHNISFCPKWHPAAGSEAWLFIDEFVVQ